MRASTFFALVISVLLGFAALGGARYFGFFEPKPPPVRLPQPKVLVAKKNLYKKIAITPVDVELREMTSEEVRDSNLHPEKYLSPTIQAAVLRVPNRDIEAGQILYKDFLNPQGIPDPLSERIAPGMVAVHVSVPKEYAAGGVIRVDDHVDVLLTSRITADGKDDKAMTKTAYLARGLRVILKQDRLLQVLAPLPENKPVSYTLEANPYRAALIDFAAGKGQLILQPAPLGAAKPDYKDQASHEYGNEEERIAGILKGNRSLGNGDLERIFHLPPLPVKETMVVELFQGNKKKETMEYTQAVALADRRTVDPDQPGYGYHFSPPPPTVEPAPASGGQRTVPALRPAAPPARPGIQAK